MNFSVHSTTPTQDATALHISLGALHALGGRDLMNLVKLTRNTLTLRSLRIGTVVKDGTPCRCEFPHVCDTRVQEETAEANSALNVDELNTIP